MVFTGSRGELPSKCAIYWNNFKEIMKVVTNTYCVLPAVSPALEREAYKIRHKVYCQELQYEDMRASNEEVDSFDKHSSHIIIHNKKNSSYIGCLRMVHAHHQGHSYSLPFEEHCEGKLDMEVVNRIKRSGEKYAEISRLAIDKEFRHIGRKGKGQILPIQKQSSIILFSLYLGLYSMAEHQGIRYLFAIVEPRLLKSLHNISVPAIQIGEGIDHRGLRIPILIDVQDLTNAIPKIIPRILMPLHNTIKNNISRLLSEEPVVTKPLAEDHGIPDFTFYPYPLATDSNFLRSNREVY